MCLCSLSHILWPFWKADFGCYLSENTDMSFNCKPEEIIIPQKVRDIADKTFQRYPKLFYVDLSPFVALVFDYCSTLWPLIISRKNMLFCGNHEAAENAAIICSLLGSCKERGAPPKSGWMMWSVDSLIIWLPNQTETWRNCYRMYGENNQDSSGKMQEKTGKSETDTQWQPWDKLVYGNWDALTMECIPLKNWMHKM